MKAGSPALFSSCNGLLSGRFTISLKAVQSHRIFYFLSPFCACVDLGIFFSLNSTQRQSQLLVSFLFFFSMVNSMYICGSNVFGCLSKETIENLETLTAIVPVGWFFFIATVSACCLGLGRYSCSNWKCEVLVKKVLGCSSGNSRRERAGFPVCGFSVALNLAAGNQACMSVACVS